MNKKKIIILALICLLTFGVRLIPFQNVFGSDYVSFLETDAYNRMYYAKMIYSMPFGDAVSFTLNNALLWSGLVAFLGHVFPIELVGAWLPPLMAVTTVLLVYGIADTLFKNDSISYLSAGFVAVIPSEFLHRTLLGFADHHAMEIMLMTLSVYLYIRLLKAEKRRYLWAIGTGLSIYLYLATWKAGMLLLGIIGLFAAVVLIYGLIKKTEWKRTVAYTMLLLGVTAVLYLPASGFDRLMGFFPSTSTDIPVAQSSTQEMVSTILTPTSEITIGEIRPLFFPFGSSFNPGVVMLNLHLFSVLFIAGATALWFYRKDKSVIFLALWSVVMLTLALLQRKFLYYFTLPCGILSAVAIYELAGKFKANRAFASAVFGIPLILVSLTLAGNIGKNTRYQMPNEWNKALTWLDSQQVSGHVTTWSDYGHWIKYVTGDEPNLLPGPGGQDVARLLLSDNAYESAELMDKLDTDYLIVDNSLLDMKLTALVMVANVQENVPVKDTLLYKLIERNDPQPYLTNVYESETIKIFKYKSY